ncbi:MAG: sensor histidine kinase [Bdellovibrionota bacterium]
MSLYQFLLDKRDQIISASEERTVALAALRPNSTQLRSGLPIFFDQLVDVLKKQLSSVGTQDECEISDSAGAHGKELLRLGYTLTHVVHSYGAMCQAITEVASQTKATVTALEFHLLNRCLDIAIAGAVTEFESLRSLENKNREVVHLGAIAHELRNALNRARISFQMLSKGIVGLGGSTSKVLERSLDDMDVLINRSLSEVRLRVDSEINEEYFTIIEIVSQLVVTAEIEAGHRQQTITVEVDPEIGVITDRHLIIGAIGNLLQNALKFTKLKGNIWIVGKRVGDEIAIEVRDQCGGIPPSKIGGLFKPFVQQDTDRSGLGLGLLISKQAIEKCGGTLSVHNSANGCVFTAKLPAREAPSEPKPGPVV